jgi:hypothetical protein
MKKIPLFILLFISITTSAQNNAAEDTTAKLIVTEIGKPDGEKTEMKIDKDGGSITSSDGKMKIIIPASAVSKKTTFSIQPATNLMPNGSGKSYQMEPSGIIFQVPLQIIFYYTDAETKGNSPELLSIAMQDDKGQWFAPNKITTDTIAKTLAAEILHFSSYIIYELASIYPESARLKVNGSLRLRITNVGHFTGGETHTYINGIEVQQPLKVKTGSAEVWKVNGIEKGNSAVGLISASQDYTAIFQAPAQVPSQNPVAVTVQENVSEEYAVPFYRTHNIYTLVSHITIYDGDYEVIMESVMRSGGKKAWGGIRTATDKGSFIVSLENNKPVLINIINNLEVMTNDCKNKILNPTTCTGLLHVAGIKNFKVTPANPPGQPYSTVEIWFVPFPIEFTKSQFLCPPPPGYTQGGVSGKDITGLSMNFGSALPWNIKFLAKDGEQIIVNSKDEEGSLKILVRKIKDD